MNIRRAKIEDLKSVQELNSMLFKKEVQDFDQNFDDTWAFSENGIKCISDWIQSGNSITLVAEEAGNIVGYLAGEIREVPAWRKQSKTAELAEIYILDEHRSRGIGGQFMKGFLDWCRGKGVKKVKLEASMKNQDALRFYKKYGLREQEVIMKMEL